MPSADEDIFDPLLSGLHSFPLRHWRQLLPNDPLYNQNVRREFYYEHTPNTTLCLALADLMGDRRVSAAFLLDCCHTVSAQLVPDSQGRVNEEVDHYFVIGSVAVCLFVCLWICCGFVCGFVCLFVCLWVYLFVFFVGIFNLPICMSHRLLQNLLLNAKLRFEEAGDSPGVELCDT